MIFYVADEQLIVIPMTWAKHGYVRTPEGKKPDRWGTYKKVKNDKGQTLSFAAYLKAPWGEDNLYPTEEEAIAAIAAYRIKESGDG